MEPRAIKILLVEDNEGDVELTRIALAKSGVACDLVVASNGYEGLDCLFKRGQFSEMTGRPDIILLDLNMPRMGGKEFLEIVKENGQLKSIPVIVLTSSRAPADIHECYQRHANCYVLKPTGLEHFIAMARQLEAFWGRLVQLPFVA